MTVPKFSIVIPCFNCAETIESTLVSVQSQTVTDWEAICVDDGSSDDTIVILERLAKKDSRIRILQQTNAGPSRARNNGVDQAQGDIVAFLDADDLWLPGKLASVANAFRSHVDAAFGRIVFFRFEDEGDVTTSSVRPGFAELQDFLGENPVCTLSNLSVKRSVFLESGGFDETMRFSEDLEWLIRGLVNGLKLVATNDLHVRYRTSDAGLSADLHAMHAGWKRAIASAEKALSVRDLATLEAVHLRYLARRALRTHAPARDAVSLALKALKLAPKVFISDGHRGPLTLIGCLVAPIIPAQLRRRIFA